MTKKYRRQEFEVKWQSITPVHYLNLNKLMGKAGFERPAQPSMGAVGLDSGEKCIHGISSIEAMATSGPGDGEPMRDGLTTCRHR